MTKSFPTDNEVKLQFVAALDAWIKLEHALWKLFYVLLKPISAHRSQSLFNAINGFQAQREAVTAIASDAIADTAVLEALGDLQDRARGLATKRNYLVHGRWIPFNTTRHSPNPDVLIRIYRPANFSRLFKDGDDLRSKKGRYVFFIDDMKRCQQEFSALADDYDTLRMQIADHLQVSPHIEIPAEGVVGPIVRMTPNSSHPQEDR